jgi:hypothetical protein
MVMPPFLTPVTFATVPTKVLYSNDVAFRRAVPSNDEPESSRICDALNDIASMNVMVGIKVGTADGTEEGVEVGTEEGWPEGMADGSPVGVEVGMEKGWPEGTADGSPVGSPVGDPVASEVGSDDGIIVGDVGVAVNGICVGWAVGSGRQPGKTAKSPPPDPSNMSSTVKAQIEFISQQSNWSNAVASTNISFMEITPPVDQ